MWYEDDPTIINANLIENLDSGATSLSKKSVRLALLALHFIRIKMICGQRITT